MSQLTHVDTRLAFHWPTVPAFGIPLAFPDGDVEGWSIGAGADPYLVDVGAREGEDDMDMPIGFFTDGNGGRYIMVQNGRHTHADWPSDGATSSVIRLVFDFASAPPNIDSSRLHTLDNETGERLDVTLSDGNDGTKVLETTLGAGDVMLLKYVDGTPFARRSNALP